MGAVVPIARRDLAAAELRAAAGRERDGAAARRTPAIALVLAGADGKRTAEISGMDRQTPRDRVHRDNAQGLRGLHDLKAPGPQSMPTVEYR